MAPRSSSSALGPFLGLVAGVAVGSVGTLLLRSRRVVQAVTAKRPADALADKSIIIDPALTQGNVEIGKLPLCQIFLCDDSRFRGWLILVPRRNDLVEVIDLTEEGQEVMWKEVASALRVLQRIFKPKKLNVSAIGNQTRQLHIHVSARYANDAAFPGVHLSAAGSGRKYFAPDELQQLRQDLIQAFKEEEPQFVAEED